jgi:hypothetical protein
VPIDELAPSVQIFTANHAPDVYRGLWGWFAFSQSFTIVQKITSSLLRKFLKEVLSHSNGF